MAKKQRPSSNKQVLGFLGVGLDHADDEKRITRSENFIIVGGSKDTHERMQDTAIRFDDELRRRGKPIHETPVEEVIEILHEAQE